MVIYRFPAVFGRWPSFARPPRGPALPKPISDHAARDIGLSGAHLAWHRHEWPSQSLTHPRL